MIAWGLVAAALMPVAYYALVKPFMLLEKKIVHSLDNGQREAAVAWAALYWTVAYFFALGWVLIVFRVSWNNSTIDNEIPILLWAYSIALLPLRFMAQPERLNLHTFLTVFAAHTSYLGFLVFNQAGLAFGAAVLLLVFMCVLFVVLEFSLHASLFIDE
ncbi:hypothetical protein [Zeimonas arvi]|uniref:Uncharacterized protein n=1 Tax=Zeimonas arvi TaxID=2498847 RepID=A0A5C8NKS9_9BURK|nr:hypothetical protein [Zeimonas arvi]TXL62464.1 hypothetical protein FHP08_18040 [Zeimonas arvi]